MADTTALVQDQFSGKRTSARIAWPAGVKSIIADGTMSNADLASATNSLTISLIHYYAGAPSIPVPGGSSPWTGGGTPNPVTGAAPVPEIEDTFTPPAVAPIATEVVLSSPAGISAGAVVRFV